MKLKINKGKKSSWYFKISMLTLVMTATVMGCVSCLAPSAKKFATPQAAVEDMVSAARHNNEKGLVAIFGPEGKEVFTSGDAVRDQLGRRRFLEVYDVTNSLVAEGDNMILVIGKEQWPFPVPIVRSGNEWFFDVIQGKDEILSRRIGRSELATIQVCLAMVDAEREYAMKDRDGDGVLAYAEKCESDPGMKNGLYWKTREGEAPSPLGPEVARAIEAGYGASLSSEDPVPFFGYYYRLLTRQGKDAPGGAYDYVVNGKMIGGFAVVAYPAQYKNSGVMTFIVNHDGIVYEKDLGENSMKLAKEMKEYNCDASWKKAGDSSTSSQK